MSRHPPLRAAIELILALTVFCCGLSHGLFPERADQDFWWHLKTGKIIVENDYRLPEKDVFSFTSADYAWHNHEWLTQIAMYHVYRWGESWHAGRGTQWVIIAKALVIAVAYFLLFLLLWRRAGNLPLAALLAVIAINCSRFTMYPRPPVITYLFIPLFLFAIHFYLTNKHKWPLLLGLPALMVLWVNLHGGYILGLIILAACGGGEGLLAAGFYLFQSTRPYAARRFRQCLIFTAACALCALATLVNPYGWKLYGMFSRVMSDSALVHSIPELLPPELWHTPAFLLMLALLCPILVIPEIFIYLLLWKADARVNRFDPLDWLRRMQLHPGEILLALFITEQALSHVRHLPIFALLTAPLLAVIYELFFELSCLGRKNKPDAAADPDSANAPDSAAAWRAPHYCCAVLALGFALYYFYFQDRITDRQFIREHKLSRADVRYMTYFERNKRLLGGMSAEPYKFPEELCDFILAHPFHGRMYNTVYDAGYLIWRLSPRPHQTFTDDRFDIFGGRFLPDTEIIRTAQEPLAVPGGTQPGWRELLGEWRINFVVIGQGEPLAKKLFAENGGAWTLVYGPSPKIPLGHFIFVRNAAENQDLIESCQRSIQQRQLR